MYRCRQFRAVVGLSSTCKYLESIRQKAIVKHTFRKIPFDEYYPRILPLYVMRYCGLPVGKQYRKIDAKPWDVVERYRHERWTSPPVWGSAYAELFHQNMKSESPMFDYVGDLPGLFYCERQLASGSPSEGWPLKSRFYARLLIRLWRHASKSDLFSYLCDKIELDAQQTEKNFSTLWAYFLSLNRLASSKISLKDHYEFVQLLKELTGSKLVWSTNPLTALPPINSPNLELTLAQIQQDDFVDTPGVYMRVLLSHLQDMYISLDHPKKDADGQIKATYLKYRLILRTQYHVLDDQRFVYVDGNSVHFFKQFDIFMTECIGREWTKTFKKIAFIIMMDDPEIERV